MLDWTRSKSTEREKEDRQDVPPQDDHAPLHPAETAHVLLHLKVLIERDPEVLQQRTAVQQEIKSRRWTSNVPLYVSLLTVLFLSFTIIPVLSCKS